ncbi:MAG TPA: MFS transporter [Candidatus Dormibacteraeota bacterium]|jgi:MFS family permease|nr:MFS transporter [Candidatus Dormibacteraeota bacterium]
MSKLIPSVLRNLSRDGWLLFITRFARLFAYGSLSVILVFYLVGLGLSESQVGLVLTLTLAGDVIVSLYLTTRADRIGRRRMLIVGAILMAAAGLAFALSSNLFFLVIAGTIGVISPSGNEVGPFLSIEQAALSHIVPATNRTEVFAWYTLAGSLATALGALCGGGLVQVLEHTSITHLQSYRAVVFLYAALGAALALLFLRLSTSVEVSTASNGPTPSSSLASIFGIARSRSVVLKLSGLFALDSFAGGFVVQSFAAYWFYLRFGVQPAALGAIFFWANVFAGISALLATRLAARIGLIRTMVVTHLPSNILLILVPLMPNLPLAVLMLLLRFSISQMDVPTRQSYTMAVVPPEERSAAGGFTGVARTTGAAISPLLAGFLFASPSLISAPFFIAGTLKIIYDILLYYSFQKVRPPEEP